MAKVKSQAQRQLEVDVKRERRRIQQIVRRLERKGYSFSKSIVPTLPKNITEATLRKYKGIDINYIYKQSVYVSPEGTIVSGLERRAEERHERSQKASETRKKYYASGTHNKAGTGKIPKEADVVLDNIEKQIDVFTIEDIEFQINEWLIDDRWSRELVILKNKDVNLLKQALDRAISENGREAVARRIQENATKIMSIVSSVLYESGSKFHDTGRQGMNAKIQEFYSLISGHSLTARESMRLTDTAEAINEGI